jgi:hypothetical protein
MKMHRVAFVAAVTPVSELISPNPINPPLPRALLHGLRSLGSVEGAKLPRRSLNGLLPPSYHVCFGVQKGYARHFGKKFLQQLQPLCGVFIATGGPLTTAVPTGERVRELRCNGKLN